MCTSYKRNKHYQFNTKYRLAFRKFRCSMYLDPIHCCLKKRRELTIEKTKTGEKKRAPRDAGIGESEMPSLKFAIAVGAGVVRGILVVICKFSTLRLFL